MMVVDSMIHIYTKAKNGMMVRIPSDRLEEWKKWQENPDPDAQKKLKEDLKAAFRQQSKKDNK